MHTNNSEKELLDRLRRGDKSAVDRGFERYRGQLKRLVGLRLDRRLQGRIDASDIMQEAYLEATRRLGEYLADPSMPFYLWLRFITTQKLAEMHRRHLGTQSRDASREVSLDGAITPEATSNVLARQLLGKFHSPSEQAIRNELREQLQDALDQLAPLDREVIALRHFEKLSNKEVALVMGLSDTAANSRYFRAMKRLKALLTELPGFGEEVID